MPKLNLPGAFLRAWLVILALLSSGCLDDIGQPGTSGSGGASVSATGSVATGTTTSTASSTSASTSTGGPTGECKPGTTEPCYTGPMGTEGVGICKEGVQVCDEHGSFSGPCLGEVLPQPETCLTPVDDNCNGEVNEGGVGCVCIPDEMQSCYTGPAGTLDVGICTAGVETCNALGTAYGPCIGEITPQPETCYDDVDDDCNGETNEDGPGCVCTPSAVSACYTGPVGTLGVGACVGGMQECDALGTAYGPCVGEVTPLPESCLTPVDDNCNGQVNEGCICTPSATTSCYTGPPGTEGVGACAPGLSTCNALGTATGPCLGQVTPLTEVCGNHIDDNCNGLVDEGCACTLGQTTSCYTGPADTEGVGPCVGGTQTCTAQLVFGPCAGEVTPVTELCGNGIDDNCNGMVDEGCVCAPSAVTACYTGPAGTEGVGACTAGTSTCNALGTVIGPCLGEVTPVPESCLTPVDDNCNGQVNEGCICAPSATTACYTGPAGTSGVGVCTPGTQTCNALGTVEGPCLGQVLPQVQPYNCATQIDESCTGQTPPCTGAYIGAHAWGSPLDDEGIAVAVDPSNNVLLAGYFSGTIDFGCGPITGTAAGSALVLKLSPAGACIWSKTWGAQDQVFGIATDAGGNVFITGPMAQPVDFGGGLLPWGGGGNDDVYVAKFDPSGNYLWAKSFGDVSNQDPASIAVDPSGNVLLTGYFRGTINFGGQDLVSVGSNDIFLAKLTSSGVHLWSQRFGDAANQLPRTVTSDASGNVILVGSFNGTVDFSGGTVMGATLISAGLGDAFVAKFSPAGLYQWSNRYGDATDESAGGAATDAAGNVFVTGNFAGTINLGGPPLMSLGSTDVFLVKLSPAGAYLWGQARGGPNNQNANGLAVDLVGNVVIVGELSGSADFGGGTLTDLGNGDIFVAKYDTTGAYLWAERFGNPSTQAAKAVTTDASANVIAVGIIFGPTDFGGGAVPYVGGEDVFVVKLAP